jgi:hypothetical protein
MGVGPRTLNEVKGFSADVFAYWTSPAESRLWGHVVRTFPRAEGELFPTFSALVLAATGTAASLARAWRDTRSRDAVLRGLTPVLYVLIAACAVYSFFVVLILTGNGFTRLGPFPISARNLWRNARLLAIFAGLLLAVSPRARAFVGRWGRSVIAFAVLAGTVAFLLSLGPEIRAGGRLIGEVGPYHFLYASVPGFDGLRVPARYAMLVTLFLSIAAGFGAAVIERRLRRGTAIALSLGLLAVAEAFAAPIMLNANAADGRYAPPPPRVYTGDRVPRVYGFLKTLPKPGTVVVEFPLGEWAYELLAPPAERLQRPFSAQLQHERHTPAPPARPSRRRMGDARRVGRHARGDSRPALP